MKTRSLIYYGLPGVPLALVALPTVILIPTYYAEALGMGFGAVALAFLIARFWDLVSDPLVGVISDRLPTGVIGRRKLPMLIGAPLLMLGAWQLCHPDDPTTLSLTGWLVVLYSGWTLIFIPYMAWGAELDSHPHQRSRLSAAREGAAIVGTLLALSLPPLLAGAADPQQQLPYLATIILIATLAGIAVPLIKLPERPRSAAINAWSGVRSAVLDRHFMKLWCCFLANATANALPASLFLLYLTHIIGAEQHAPWLLLLYFLAGVAALPVWLSIAQRLGKQRTWALSMLVAVVAFCWTPFLSQDDIVLFTIICLLSGFCLGVDMALPASLQADLINADSQGHTPAAAGSYFGLWGIATKLSLGLAVAISFGALGFAGGVTDAAPANLTLLALLYGGLPVMIKLILIPLVWNLQIRANNHGWQQKPLPC